MRAGMKCDMEGLGLREEQAGGDRTGVFIYDCDMIIAHAPYTRHAITHKSLSIRQSCVNVEQILLHPNT